MRFKTPSLSILLLGIMTWFPIVVFSQNDNESIDVNPQDIPHKIAVLPFVWGDEANESVKEKHPDGPALARRIFYETFSLLGYDEVPLDTVDQMISIENVKSMEFSGLKDYGVDGAIWGAVHHLSIGKGGVISRSAAEIEFSFVNVETGKEIWSVHDESSRMGGVLLNSGQLTRAFDSISEDMDERQQEISFVLLDLYNKVFETLPAPKVDITPPHMKSYRVLDVDSSPDGHAHGLMVWLVGEAGCNAFFDLSNDRRYLPMIELEPGKYYGFAGVDQIPDSIRLKLVDGLGIQTEQEVTP